MGLKDFRETFLENFENFNSCLIRYFKKYKPSLAEVEEYAKITFYWYYPNINENIISNVIDYSKKYFELYQIKTIISNELYKLQK